MMLSYSPSCALPFDRDRWKYIFCALLGQLPGTQGVGLRRAEDEAFHDRRQHLPRVHVPGRGPDRAVLLDIARQMHGTEPGTDDYSIPIWGAGGLPFSIENLLGASRGSMDDIRGPIEWPAAVTSVNRSSTRSRITTSAGRATSRSRRPEGASSIRTSPSRDLR